VSCPSQIASLISSDLPVAEQVNQENNSVERMKAEIIGKLQEKINIDCSYGYVTLGVSSGNSKSSVGEFDCSSLLAIGR